MTLLTSPQPTVTSGLQTPSEIGSDFVLTTLPLLRPKFEWDEPHVYNEELMRHLRWINISRAGESLSSNQVQEENSPLMQAVTLSCQVKDQAITGEPQFGIWAGNVHHMISLAGVSVAIDELKAASYSRDVPAELLVATIAAPHSIRGRVSRELLNEKIWSSALQPAESEICSQHLTKLETLLQIAAGKYDADSTAFLRENFHPHDTASGAMALGLLSAQIMTAHRLPSEELVELVKGTELIMRTLVHLKGTKSDTRISNRIKVLRTDLVKEC
mgnify:CR=1 FL=1